MSALTRRATSTAKAIQGRGRIKIASIRSITVRIGLFILFLFNDYRPRYLDELPGTIIHEVIAIGMLFIINGPR